MSGYLVEVYQSRSPANAASPSPADVAHAADQLTHEGKPVRLLQSLFVPEDETCFFLFDAQSSEAVVEAASRSGLRFERLVRAEDAWTSNSRPAISAKEK